MVFSTTCKLTLEATDFIINNRGLRLNRYLYCQWSWHFHTPIDFTFCLFLIYNIVH
jgi:hypothetical protein